MLRSEIGAAAGMLMVGAVAYRMRQPVKRWWREHGQLNGPGPLSHGTSSSGPTSHRQNLTHQNPRAQVMTNQRKNNRSRTSGLRRPESFTAWFSK